MEITISGRENDKRLENLMPSLESQLSIPDESRRCWKTILLVEDEPLVREITAEMLQMQGYAVLTAENASDAIRIFQQHQAPIHLLLTDVVMPGMNGRDLASRLVSCQSDLRTVFISGYTDNAVLRDGFRDPNTAYLQKPFTLGALVKKVQEVIGADLQPSSAAPLQ